MWQSNDQRVGAAARATEGWAARASGRRVGLCVWEGEKLTQQADEGRGVSPHSPTRMGSGGWIWGPTLNWGSSRGPDGDTFFAWTPIFSYWGSSRGPVRVALEDQVF
jgi:hypothetical protein